MLTEQMDDSVKEVKLIAKEGKPRGGTFLLDKDSPIEETQTKKKSKKQRTSILPENSPPVVTIIQPPIN